MEGIRRIQEESLYMMLKIFLKIFLILAHGFGDFRPCCFRFVSEIMARAHRTVNLHDGGLSCNHPLKGISTIT